jgi:hypothetical protein
VGEEPNHTRLVLDKSFNTLSALPHLEMADWNCCLDEDIPDELPDIGGEPGIPSVLHDHPLSAGAAQENSLEVVKPREIVRKQKVRGPQST